MSEDSLAESIIELYEVRDFCEALVFKYYGKYYFLGRLAAAYRRRGMLRKMLGAKKARQRYMIFIRKREAFARLADRAVSVLDPDYREREPII